MNTPAKFEIVGNFYRSMPNTISGQCSVDGDVQINAFDRKAQSSQQQVG
jgi:hypothetical protein